MLRAAHLLQLTVISLLGLALVMVPSAGLSVEGHLAPTAFLKNRHTIYATLAIAALLLTSRIDARQLFFGRGLKNPVPWLIFLTVGLLVATAVPGVGVTVNGARRWLPLWPQWGLTFQPSEMAKWAVVLAIASWCARRRGVLGRFRYGLAPPLLLIATICGLIVISDLGTAVLVGLVGVGLLLAGGARLIHLIAIVPVGFAAIAFVIVRTPFRLARLTAFLDPWSDPAGTGYHPIQSMLAFARGGLAGRGLGNGIQKFGYLPEDTTDFLFAIICEELGLCGAVLVVALYLLLLGAGIAVMLDCRDVFGRLLTLGVLLAVGLQALINLAVVTVMMPTKGIALPLLSAGGTGWILTAGAIGLLASLDEGNRKKGSDAAFPARRERSVEGGRRERSASGGNRHRAAQSAALRLRLDAANPDRADCDTTHQPATPPVTGL